MKKDEFLGAFVNENIFIFNFNKSYFLERFPNLYLHCHDYQDKTVNHLKRQFFLHHRYLEFGLLYQMLMDKHLRCIMNHTMKMESSD